jgi:hypothetical protein
VQEERLFHEKHTKMSSPEGSLSILTRESRVQFAFSDHSCMLHRERSLQPYTLPYSQHSGDLSWQRSGLTQKQPPWLEGVSQPADAMNLALHPYQATKQPPTNQQSPLTVNKQLNSKGQRSPCGRMDAEKTNNIGKGRQTVKESTTVLTDSGGDPTSSHKMPKPNKHAFQKERAKNNEGKLKRNINTSCLHTLHTTPVL